MQKEQATFVELSEKNVVVVTLKLEGASIENYDNVSPQFIRTFEWSRSNDEAIEIDECQYH